MSKTGKTRLNSPRERPVLSSRNLSKLNAVDATPSIEDEMRKIAGRVPDEEWDKLPPDLIDRLDYYLYGGAEEE